MSKPKKQDLRAYARRLRDDMIRFNAALTTDDARAIKIYLSDALACLDEVANLAEERYEISVECEAQSNPMGGADELFEAREEIDDEKDYEDEGLEEGDEDEEDYEEGDE